MYLPHCLFVSLFGFLSVCPSICPSIHTSIPPSILNSLVSHLYHSFFLPPKHFPVCFSVCLFLLISVSQSLFLFVCLSFRLLYYLCACNLFSLYSHLFLLIFPTLPLFRFPTLPPTFPFLLPLSIYPLTYPSINVHISY